jgi:hypothetical protein
LLSYYEAPSAPAAAAGADGEPACWIELHIFELSRFLTF